MRAKTFGRPPQQLAGPRVFAELRHRDAAQRKCRRVVTQRNVFEGAEHVATGESTRSRGNQGIHRDRLPHGTAALTSTCHQRFEQGNSYITCRHLPM
jgi:hypothetical protein